MVTKPIGQPTLESAITALLQQAAARYFTASGQTAPPGLAPTLELPRNPDHGDWATNFAMRLAKPLKLNPMVVAEGLVAQIPANELLATPEIAKPGFINLRLTPGAAAHVLASVEAAGEAYGCSTVGNGHRVLIEFVSANPTGPLHIGHCRGALVGDALARILAAAGYDVSREYYYNDAGVQMQRLGESMRVRYLQALGETIEFPDDGYHGDYLLDFAADLVVERGEAMRSETDWRPFTKFAAERVMKFIDADMEALRIHFDSWFSETTLHANGKVAEVIERLKREGRVYEQDGAWWLRTTEFGDEKDRVVIKTDGEYTYLAPDIAYHQHKFDRGFDRLINVLGADHHGYVPRLKAAVTALGYQASQLDCAIVQMVAVERSGETVKLGKRAGDYITLKEVIEEIGVDVLRFLFLTRSADSQMVFDFDLARDTSMNNPVYYVQYAHARCCSLLAKAAELGHAWQGHAAGDAALLALPEELAIIKQMDRLESVVRDIAAHAEPMPMTAYLRDLATAFHSYYSIGNRSETLRVVLPDNPALTQARLTLIAALRQVLANGLGLLGIVPLDRL